MHDGETALVFLASEVLDLVILDINLPGLSGLEILPELRRKKIHTPVLLLTARDMYAGRKNFRAGSRR